MASSYPGGLDSLTRVAGTDYLDDPGKELDVMINGLADAIEATQAAVGATGATDPATVEKRITDAAAAAAQAAADLAAYETTSDAATAMVALTLATHTALTSAHGTSTYGATLVDDADAATARATLGLGSAATTASSAYATATQGTDADNHAADTANPHAVTATQVGAPSGSGTSTGTNTGNETTTTLGALVSGATAKTTPVGADQFGIVDSSAANILKKLSWPDLKASLQALTVGSWTYRATSDTAPVLIFQDSTGAVSREIRVSAAALACIADGLNAQSSLTTGSYDNAFGRNAQYSLATGSNDNAFGYNAQYSLTTGNSDNSFGHNAQSSLTTGSYDNAFGHNAQRFLATGSYNNAFGHYAQRFVADGVTSCTEVDNSNYFGADTKASANGVTNENVFGHSATGLGSNTVVLGAAPIVTTGLFGTVALLASTSTTERVQRAAINPSWTDSTHATRKGRVTITAGDYGGSREGLRVEASGTAVMTSVNGVAAVARQAAPTAVAAACPAGGAGVAAGAFSSSTDRDAMITLINNLRTRSDQLETALRNFGITI